MSKRSRVDRDGPVADVHNREIGQLCSRSFARRRGGSLDLVLRLEMFKMLERHKGCVNAVSFNAEGDILISGSDDKTVKLWDWETGRMNLSFHSGHASNVFQAKFLPFSDDRSIVTCAADGQVRHAQILERGEVQTVMLSSHEGRVHNLAIGPGSPHIFYTCGEDGMVQQIDLRTAAVTRMLTCHARHDFKSYTPIVHLNAIAIDPRNPNYTAVAGSDEYTRLYDIRKYKRDSSSSNSQPVDYFCPSHLIGNHIEGITGLAISDKSELLVSYNDESIYLFTKDMGLGADCAQTVPLSMGDDEVAMDDDVCIAATSMSKTDNYEKCNPQVYTGHRNCETVKGVTFFGPNCEYVASGSDCGQIFIWKTKSGELIRVMEADNHVVNCIEPHPHAMVLASSGIDKDVKLWTPTAIERASLPAKINKRPRARGWIHPLASPRDLLAQLLSIRETRTTSSGERRSTNSALARELLDLVLSFDVTSDGSDDGRDTSNTGT